MFAERLIRSISVRTRLLVALLFVSIVPAVVIGVYAYQAYTNSIVEKLADSSVQTVHQLNGALSTELRSYAQFIDQVSISSEVQASLVERRGGQSLRREIESILIRSGYLRGLRVTDANGVSLYDDGLTRINEDEFHTLLRNAEAASTSDSLYHIGGPRIGTLTIGRKIFMYPQGQQHIGYVFAFISDSLLNGKLLDGVSLGGGGVMLLSADGMALAGSTSEPGTRLDGTDLYAQLLESDRLGLESFKSEVDGTPSLVVFSRNTQYDAYLLAAIPLSYISEETGRTGQRLVVIVAIAALFCVALSLWIYRSVATPINRIVMKCSGLPEGGGRIEDNNPDELGFLSRAVDQYTAALESMTQIRVADQRRKRELELEALQYQINPHFLFNTLGTLKWVAVINEAPPVISEGISSLSALLHNVLLKKDELIPIREELDILECYFKIQKIRYAECFEVIYEVDEKAAAHKIPRFTLQPLAENSILHGAEGGGRTIVITVRCKLVQAGVLVEIEDDGNGFDPDTVKNNTEGRFSGIGLTNVDERLKLHFGEGYGLDIRSRPGEGATCSVLIPCILEEGGADDVQGSAGG